MPPLWKQDGMTSYRWAFTCLMTEQFRWHSKSHVAQCSEQLLACSQSLETTPVPISQRGEESTMGYSPVECYAAGKRKRSALLN